LNFQRVRATIQKTNNFPTTSQLLPNYFPTTSQLFPNFPTTSQLLPNYFPTTSQLTSQLLPNYFPTTSQLLPSYFPTTSQLLPNYFPTTSQLLPNSSLPPAIDPPIGVCKVNYATFRDMRKIKACGSQPRKPGAAPASLPHAFILRMSLYEA
jgi:hypothetical protein